MIKSIMWKGDNLLDIINMIGLHPSACKWTWEEYEEIVRKEGLKIFTSKGSIMVNIKDRVVLDLDTNEIDVVDPKTYEERLMKWINGETQE